MHPKISNTQSTQASLSYSSSRPSTKIISAMPPSNLANEDDNNIQMPGVQSRGKSKSTTTPPKELSQKNLAYQKLLDDSTDKEEVEKIRREYRELLKPRRTNTDMRAGNNLLRNAILINFRPEVTPLDGEADENYVQGEEILIVPSEN
mmetsp:Transcript_7424/g.6763  ORF Transcript_7424/g.6763 Transcript_7424/m.6763 type:complete len:148 (-) Transcript_7424:221-664(-)